MHFGDITALYLLWLLPFVAILLLAAIKRRRAMMEKFIDTRLMAEIAKNLNPSRWIWKSFLILGTFIFSILALARPQWGFEWREVKRQGVDMIVAVDTSKSMLTQDVKPNRLERTKLAIHDLISQLKGDRIGLVAFAGDAFMLCPLTVDYNGFLLSLKDLDVHSVPRGGTNIGGAIEEALKSFDQTPSQFKVVIVVTDGDNLEGDPLSAAHKAKDKGVRIYTVGIGTPEGELIQIVNENGDKEFLKDENGNFIKSRLNEKLLTDIALTTDGAYVRATGAEFGLDTIYERNISKLEKREFENKMDKRYFERFQFPLAIATVLLLFETCIGTRKRQF
jgi:Ca-activated chloride channel family protein